jgi:hypothetical protein
VEETRELAALDMKKLDGITLSLERNNPEKSRDMIDTIRRMETNTSLYAAGGFAPMLVLLNQIQYLATEVDSIERLLALLSILALGTSGIILVLYRAFYINFIRTKVELFLGGIIPGESLKIEALKSRIWLLLIWLAFILLPIGWALMGGLVIRLLQG